MNTFNRIMPFMERTLGMRNGGSKFFMGWYGKFLFLMMFTFYVENGFKTKRKIYENTFNTEKYLSSTNSQV